MTFVLGMGMEGWLRDRFKNRKSTRVVCLWPTIVYFVTWPSPSCHADGGWVVWGSSEEHLFRIAQGKGPVSLSGRNCYWAAIVIAPHHSISTSVHAYTLSVTHTLAHGVIHTHTLLRLARWHWRNIILTSKVHAIHSWDVWVENY